MNRTTENLLTWAPVGAAVALMLSDHRRMGLAMAMVPAAVVMYEHPRGTRKALRSVPKSFESIGKAVSRAGVEMGKSCKQAGKGLRWMAS